MILALEYARCASVANIIFYLPKGKRVTAPQPAGVPPSETRVPPSVQNGPSWEIIAFSTCGGSSVKKIRISGLDSWQAKTFGEEESYGRPARHRDWLAWPYEGVIAVKRRILPSVQSPKFPRLSVLRR